MKLEDINMTYWQWKKILKHYFIGDNIILEYVKSGERKKIKGGIAQLSTTGISVFIFPGFQKRKYISYPRIRKISLV